MQLIYSLASLVHSFLNPLTEEGMIPQRPQKENVSTEDQ